MPSSIDYDAQIRTAAAQPSPQAALELERLYRRAREAGELEAFSAAIGRAISIDEQSALLAAWGYRLDILTVKEAVADAEAELWTPNQRWALAISLSVVLGLIWSLFSVGKPPVPSPEVSAPLFWLGWAPVTAVMILSFIGTVGNDRRRRRVIVIACIVILALWFLSHLLVGSRRDAASILAALHLPILAWVAVGLAVTSRIQDRAAQRIGFILKSAEALVASGIYLAGAGIFGLLTLGIFDVLGVHFTNSWISRCAALVLGAIPLLGVASTIDPNRSPAVQDFSTGAARLARLLTRLLLTPVLAVLAVYVVWFIPRYFWRPFEQRAVLIVYNASLAAVLVLIVLAVPHLNEAISAFWSRLLRGGIRAVCALALILNLYSLSAVIARTMRYGLSPNRHAIIGWNVVTLCLLAAITASQVRCPDSDWTERFRTSFARFLPLAALWALWVLLISRWIR